MLYGVQDVDPVARETARSYGLGTWAQIRYVTWPTTLPYLMTGIRLAAAVALILAITSEVAIDTQGLGKEISDTESGGAVAVMYAYVIVAGIIGVIVNLGRARWSGGCWPGIHPFVWTVQRPAHERGPARGAAAPPRRRAGASCRADRRLVGRERR